MVAKHGGIRDSMLDHGRNDLEKGGLAVLDVVVQLITREDDEIGFLDVQNCVDELDGERVGLAGRHRLPVGINSVAAHANAGHHMCVGNLDDLERAILSRSKGKLRMLMRFI